MELTQCQARGVGEMWGEEGRDRKLEGAGPCPGQEASVKEVSSKVGVNKPPRGCIPAGHRDLQDYSAFSRLQLTSRLWVM